MRKKLNSFYKNVILCEKTLTCLFKEQPLSYVSNHWRYMKRYIYFQKQVKPTVYVWRTKKIKMRFFSQPIVHLHTDQTPGWQMMLDRMSVFQHCNCSTINTQRRQKQHGKCRVQVLSAQISLPCCILPPRSTPAFQRECLSSCRRVSQLSKNTRESRREP